MIKIKIGDKMPEIKLSSAFGKEISPTEFKGKKNLVVYFYPKADTPGCTREGIGFNEKLEDFKKLDTEIFGVSVDKPETNKKFCDKYGFRFPLLSDDGGKIAKSLGILKDTGSAMRTTFIISKDGKVVDIFENVKVDGHVEKVMESIKKLK